MAIVRRVNLIRNPSFELDLQTWSAFGSASISRVASGFGGWQCRVTFPTAAAGTSGASTTITTEVGKSYRLWMNVPDASGATTVQMEAQGIAVGAAFATNGPLFKEGNVTFTATATTTTIRLKSAVSSTAGHTVDIELGICEETNAAISDYTYFDGSFPGAYWLGPVGLAASVFEYYDTDVATWPMRVVEFDARPVSSFDFVLDRNALDDTSVALIESPRWYHVIEAERVEIRRGRQDPDTDMGAGNATITLRDYDAKYDPDNPATPLQVNGVPVMRAGMRIRVSVLVSTLGALLYEPLFTGSLEDAQIDRTYEPTTVITAVDDLAKLATSDVPPFDTPGAGGSTILRAGFLLSFAGVPFSDAVYGANMGRQMLDTKGGGNVLSQLQLVANCEGGKVFAARDGRVHVNTHSDDFSTSVAATFSDNPTASTDIEFASIVTSTGLRTTINRCVVQRGDYSQPSDGELAPTDASPSVTGQDDDSVAINTRVWSETIDAPLRSDADAQALADWRATRRSRPMTRVNSVEAQMTGQDLLGVWSCAQLDIASVVRVKRFAFGRGIDDLYGVGGIDHTIDDQTWNVSVYTEPLDITGLYADQPHPFFLDSSALDGADILSAY